MLIFQLSYQNPKELPGVKFTIDTVRRSLERSIPGFHATDAIAMELVRMGDWNRVLERSAYNPALYRVNGKIQVLQIFDREDTENNHWLLTQKWFGKTHGKPKKGADGELIYEDSNSRVVLYMGSEPKNQKFARKWAAENGRGVLTFRGHSFSLENMPARGFRGYTYKAKGNIPYDVFGNRHEHFMFLPGSCGSARSVPAYIQANPATDLRFFSNTSTGRGQVTNALVTMLLAQQKPSAFDAMIKKGEKLIAANGGDINAIKVFGPGEALLYYVIERANKPDSGYPNKERPE